MHSTLTLQQLGPGSLSSLGCWDRLCRGTRLERAAGAPRRARRGRGEASFGTRFGDYRGSFWRGEHAAARTVRHRAGESRRAWRCDFFFAFCGINTPPFCSHPVNKRAAAGAGEQWHGGPPQAQGRPQGAQGARVQLGCQRHHHMVLLRDQGACMA